MQDVRGLDAAAFHQHLRLYPSLQVTHVLHLCLQVDHRL